MKQNNFLIRVFLLLSIIFGTMNCAEDTIEYQDPDKLDLSEFTFIPVTPKTNEVTNMVFYGCTYYKTTSVVVKNNDITVRKHFNGQLKWPCIVAYDTIPLGELKKGEYQVRLEIIDVNPFVIDSVFYVETKKLTVANK